MTGYVTERALESQQDNSCSRGGVARGRAGSEGVGN